MRTLRLTLLYLLAVVIVIVLGGFVGWYFFLHVPQAREDNIDRARGLNLPSESFAGGSTQKNIGIIVGSGPLDASTSSSSAPTPSTALLWQVDKTPVAGMGFVKPATTTSLEYIERANGYVFAADFPSKSVTRLTETLTPKIYEAFISSDGGIIERSLDNTGSITTLMATVGATTSKTSTSTAQNTLLGTYISKDISTLALSPATRSIFYLIPNSSGGIDGVTAGWGAKSNPKKIFSSTITHWIPLWLPDGRLVVTESAADDMPGYSYTIANDGTLTLLIGNVPGLVLLPHSSSKTLLYSSSANGALTLFAQGATSSTPMPLSIQTVADKCVWLDSKSPIAYCAVPATPPSGPFLNLRYQGAVHTIDNWWKIDLQRGVVEQIYSPKSSNNAEIDVERPTIDPSGNYISFINAFDKSLWILKIPQ